MEEEAQPSFSYLEGAQAHDIVPSREQHQEAHPQLLTLILVPNFSAAVMRGPPRPVLLVTV